MLGSSDGQLVCGVVMNDLGDGEEGGAVLPQNVTAVRGLGELHVHEALTAPDGKEDTATFHLNTPPAGFMRVVFDLEQHKPMR